MPNFFRKKHRKIISKNTISPRQQIYKEGQDSKRIFHALKIQIEKNKENIDLCKERINNFEHSINHLEAISLSFLKRHPFVSLGYIATTLLGSIAVFGFFYVYITDSSSENINDSSHQFNQTYIPGGNISCSELYTVNVCPNMGNDRGNYSAAIHQFCLNIFQELCDAYDERDENNEKMMLSVLVGVMALLLGLVVSYYKYMHNLQCRKDDRVFADVVDDVEMQKIKDDFSSIVRDQDSVGVVKRKLKNETMLWKKKLLCFEAEGNELKKISNAYFNKVKLFFLPRQYPKLHEDTSAKSLIAMPKELIKEIFSFIDPLEDFKETEKNISLKR